MVWSVAAPTSGATVCGVTPKLQAAVGDNSDTTEQTTPTPCQPFTGALNTTGMIAPIAITQKKDDEITLPNFRPRR